MNSLTDKVVIVTGGANGIGVSLVHEFLSEDVKYVAVLDVDEVSGKRLENDLLKLGDGRVHFFKCDVTNVKELYDVFDKVFGENGVIDIVVNNAGIASETLDMYTKQIEINFTAVVSSTLKALELMREDQGGKGGTIINISSIVALSQSLGQLNIYAATKNAVLHFSNRFGLDTYYSRTKVRVLTVCFGATDTQMIKTCKGFDEIANEQVEILREYIENNSMQKPEVAARGVVEAYKKGQSGSTWLVSMDKFLDITDKIKEADKILSSVQLL